MPAVQTFFDKGPQRIWNLRPDSLALLLSMANVCAYQKVLVVESCQGLVVAAALERMGGYGHLCSGTTAERAALAPIDSVRFLNFPSRVTESLCTASIWDLQQHAEMESSPSAAAAAAAAAAAPAENGAAEAHSSQPSAAAATATPAGQLGAPTPAAATPEDAEAMQTGEGEASAAPLQSSSAAPLPADRQRPPRPAQAGGREGYRASPDLMWKLTHPGFTSCIIAAPKTDPAALLDQIWPLLAPSASFALFSTWIQPLVAAHAHLQARKQSALIQLRECWLRPYQVSCLSLDFCLIRRFPFLNLSYGHSIRRSTLLKTFC